MHYIVGTLINVNQPGRDSGTRTLSPVKRSRSIGAIGPFVRGCTYKLHNIRKLPASVYEYSFREDRTGEISTLQFETTKAADEFISKVMSDTLPDYDQYYLNRSD